MSAPASAELCTSTVLILVHHLLFCVSAGVTVYPDGDRSAKLRP